MTKLINIFLFTVWAGMLAILILSFFFEFEFSINFVIFALLIWSILTLSIGSYLEKIRFRKMCKDIRLIDTLKFYDDED